MGLGHMQKDLCKHLISNEIEASLDVTRDGPASMRIPEEGDHDSVVMATGIPLASRPRFRSMVTGNLM